MAVAIGIKRQWFPGDHYDVSLTRKGDAIRRGAVEITEPEMVSCGGGSVRAARRLRLLPRGCCHDRATSKHHSK